MSGTAPRAEYSVETVNPAHGARLPKKKKKNRQPANGGGGARKPRPTGTVFIIKQSRPRPAVRPGASVDLNRPWRVAKAQDKPIYDVVDRVYRTSADGATAYVERHLVERVLEIKVTNTQHDDTRRFTWVDGGLGKLWERICTIWPSAAEFKTETVDEETFTKDEWSGKITRTVTRQYVRHMTHRLRYVDGDPVAWRWNGQPNPQDSALVAIKTNDDLMHAVDVVEGSFLRRQNPESEFLLRLLLDPPATPPPASEPEPEPEAEPEADAGAEAEAAEPKTAEPKTESNGAARHSQLLKTRSSAAFEMVQPESMPSPNRLGDSRSMPYAVIE